MGIVSVCRNDGVSRAASESICQRSYSSWYVACSSLTSWCVTPSLRYSPVIGWHGGDVIAPSWPQSFSLSQFAPIWHKIGQNCCHSEKEQYYW